MPQPKRDPADVAGGFEDVQGPGVSLDVWRHLSARDRRFCPRCRRDMQIELRGEAEPGHSPSRLVQENVLVGHLGADGEPCHEYTGRFLPERQEAILIGLAP